MLKKKKSEFEIEKEKNIMTVAKEPENPRNKLPYYWVGNEIVYKLRRTTRKRKNHGSSHVKKPPRQHSGKFFGISSSSSENGNDSSMSDSISDRVESYKHQEDGTKSTNRVRSLIYGNSIHTSKKYSSYQCSPVS
jgi:hypothetical protein